MRTKVTHSWDVSLEVVDRDRQGRRSHVEYVVRAVDLRGAVRAAVDRARSRGLVVLGEIGAARRM